MNSRQRDIQQEIFVSSKNGDTLLHLAMRDCTDEEDITSFINQFDSETISCMAKTVNNEGLLPIQIVTTICIPDVEKDKLYFVLIPHTAPSVIKNMSEPVLFEEVKQRYHPEPDSILYQYLELACQIATDTRKLFSESSTHPQVNGMEWDQFFELRKRISDLRNIAGQKNIAIIKNYAKAQLERDDPFYYELLSNYVNLFTEKHLGNCQEQSYAALKLFHETNKQIPVALYYVSDGDHAFPIIDPNGAQVLCDPWSGTVCPGYAISKELATHNALHKISIPARVNGTPVVCNLITSFNPHYHQLEPMLLFDKFTQQLGNPPTALASPLVLTQSNLPHKPKLDDSTVSLYDSFHQDVIEALVSTPDGRKLLSRCPKLFEKINTQWLDLLIEENANLELKDNDDNTLLLRLCSMNNIDGKLTRMQKLIEKGANVNATNNKGQSALDLILNSNADKKLKKEMMTILFESKQIAFSHKLQIKALTDAITQHSEEKIKILSEMGIKKTGYENIPDRELQTLVDTQFENINNIATEAIRRAVESPSRKWIVFSIICACPDLIVKRKIGQQFEEKRKNHRHEKISSPVSERGFFMNKKPTQSIHNQQDFLGASLIRDCRK